MLVILYSIGRQDTQFGDGFIYNRYIYEQMKDYWDVSMDSDRFIFTSKDHLLDVRLK